MFSINFFINNFLVKKWLINFQNNFNFLFHTSSFPSPISKVNREKVYQWSIGQGHFLRCTLVFSKLRVKGIAQRWHCRSRLIVIIHTTLWWTCICSVIDEPIDNTNNIGNNLFTLKKCLVCGSLINTWKYIAKSRFSMRILHPFSHGHAGVTNCTIINDKK